MAMFVYMSLFSGILKYSFENLVTKMNLDQEKSEKLIEVKQK